MKMLTKPVESATVDNMVTTWAIIEARPTLPMLLAVASATEFDDTEPVARGLARVARESGQRTGYLYLGSRRRSTSETAYDYDDLSINETPSLRESFDAALDSWRKSYDIIVVDLPHLTSCPLGAHAARLAEGVVIGVQSGRKVLPADRELTALFKQLSASIIGIVKTGTASTGGRSPSPALSRSLTSRFFPVRQP